MSFIIFCLLTINLIFSTIRTAPISQYKSETNSKLDNQHENVLAIANDILQELTSHTSTKSNIIQKEGINTNNENDYIGYIPIITYINNPEWNGFDDLMNFYDRRQVIDFDDKTEVDEDIVPKKYSSII